MNTPHPSVRRFAVIAGFAAGVGLAFSTAARADLHGFTDFAPVNRRGTSATAGLSTDKTALTLTDGGKQETSSAFTATPQPVAAFVASFVYRASDFGGDGDGGADGVAFVVENDPRGAAAMGDSGGALGYGGTNPITKSIAIRLGIFGGSSESVATNGVPESYGDTVPVDLRSGHPIRVTIDYDGATVQETIKDETTGAIFREIHALTFAGGSAYVGFTGASGDATARQVVTDFTFTSRRAVPMGQRRRVVRTVKVHDSLASWVDPMIGTTAGGNVYPGAVAPFGMVQFSPDTRGTGIGYDYGNRIIQGFSLTHMSGVGCDDFGDVFLTPTVGDLKTTADDYQSPYSHRHETAAPGYYRAVLAKPNVTVELTASTHAGMARFRFPAGQAANLLVPIGRTLTYTKAARIQVVGDREIEGQVSSQSFCGAGQFSTVYFVLQLDQPFASCGTFSGAAINAGGRRIAQVEKQPVVGAYVRFPGTASRVVTARIGISFVDAAGARRNLDAEIAGKSFDAVRRETATAWERNLHAVNVAGGTDDQRTVFYTALYHCLLMPNVFSDVDGRYIGFDDKIHAKPRGHEAYANYSGWDIYRNEAALLALVAPDRMQDMCQSIVDMYAQGGWIDRWPQANTYTNVMCGSPLTSFIATAWNAGLHGFDMKTAYEGMFKDATQPAPGGKPYAGESNITWMDKVGYIPDDKEGYGSVSQTEEDCSAYAALASVARSLGKTADAALLLKRALNYRNLFDAETKFLRPRNADGSWQGPFMPTQEHGYVEGTAWHYRFLAPQDVAGLIRLFGGDDAFDAQLDTFFAYPQPGWSPQFYNPYNETDLQAPFLYDYSGAPWKTQAQVRKLLREVYKTTPDGIPGNDDCGTMSAWCVFSMLGLYPTDPARPVFELCSPIFSRATIAPLAGNGKPFSIVAPDSSAANAYIQSVHIGKNAVTAPCVRRADLVAGGKLTVTLGAAPNKTWGASAAQRPPSLSTDQP
jgi:predicted alpha-1,2-mannosidase